MALNRTNLIEENDHVMLKKADKLRLFQVQRKRDVWLDKTKFTLDGIIGHPYGSTFEVKNGKVVKIEKSKPDVTEEKAEKGLKTEKDNRNLHDLDSNQKLTTEEIEQMKKDGVTGGELIGHLIENSATFQNKTGYAQEKWVKKKKKKHFMEYTILRPNSRLLCDMYVSKGPSRICNLRIDSLAQILALGNVRAHSTVAVFDTCLGIVTGAVMERLGGFGKVISFYYGDSPMKSQLDLYDFPKEVMDTVYHFPLELVHSLHQGSTTSNLQGTDTNSTEGIADITDNTTQGTADITDNSSTEKTTDITDNNSTEKTTDITDNTSQGTADVTDNNTTEVIDDKMDIKLDSGDNTTKTEGSSNMENITGDTVDKDSNKESPTVSTENKPNSSTEGQVEQEGQEVNGDNKKSDDRGGKRGGKQNKRNRNKKPTFEERVAGREARAKEIEAARNVILQKNIDCLIIACKFHPTPIVTSLLDFISPSRQIVVYSQFKEALQDCYVQMRDHGGLVSFRMTETWLRNYQILPNRTHPVIQMSGTGGYLLTATTIIKP